MLSQCWLGDRRSSWHAAAIPKVPLCANILGAWLNLDKFGYAGHLNENCSSSIDSGGGGGGGGSYGGSLV